MASSAKDVKARKTASANRPRKAAALDAGPVTLDQARALARAKRPKLAAKAARKAVRPPSPEAVGTEREKLKNAQSEERVRRIQDYKATMTILKRRGASAPQKKSGAKSKGGKARTKAGKKSFTPLQIFAEGDSWFDYPPFLFSGGIVSRLEERLGVPILNLAKAGDEVRHMLGVEERAIITRQFVDGCPAGGPWDVMLFSGGGNDIVDNPMALWIRDFKPNASPASLIHQPRFDAALALVRAGYEDLITLRNDLSPNTHLVFHGYDYAIPDGRGVCHLGPWLKPALDLRKFPTRAAGQAVVKEMLRQFAEMLTSLAAQPGVSFINGQGTLTPQTASWHNELHPSKDGFNKFAKLFHTNLKALFPTRVA